MDTSPEKISLVLTGSDGAIIATEQETALYVQDEYVQGKTTPPHLAKLHLAMLIINELDRRPDWFEKGLLTVEMLKLQGTKA